MGAEASDRRGRGPPFAAGAGRGKTDSLRRGRVARRSAALGVAALLLLAPTLADPDQRELAHEAQGAAQEGAKLAAQLLAFGRRQPLNSETADVCALLTKFSGLLRRTLGKRST